MSVSPNIWGIISVILAAAAYIPYIQSILAGKTRPHVFTWAIWTLLTMIAFLIQFVEGAGPGGWATGVTSILCIVILLTSFKHGEKHITRSDWVTFIAALLAVPIWLATDNPVLAVIWVTIIDALGFYPTCRKSWFKPHEEMVLAHVVSIVKHIFSLMALSVVSIPTALYPASLVALNGFLVIIIVMRRYALKPQST